MIRFWDGECRASPLSLLTTSMAACNPPTIDAGRGDHFLQANSLGANPHRGTLMPSGWPTVRDLGVLNSVSVAALACHQHTSYVLLSRHSVIEKLCGAS